MADITGRHPPEILIRETGGAELVPVTDDRIAIKQPNREQNDPDFWPSVCIP
jgi:hypothetical protein